MKVLLILAVALIMAYVARSAPATAENSLCSRNAGKCVRVYDNGTIAANTGNPKASSVFIKYSKNDRVQFELKRKPGMFLMLKELNHSIVENASYAMNVTANQTVVHEYVQTVVHEYVLVVDYPSEPYLTEWEKGTTSGALVQKVDENTTCAISFDSSGKVAGPCNLSAVDSIDLI